MRQFAVLFLLVALFSAFSFPEVLSLQGACGGYTFSNSVVYQMCVDLPVLNSSLHWTYNQSTSQANIAFRRSSTSSSQWISWGINPSGQAMVGTQALIAFQSSTNGSMVAYTTSVDSYGPSLTPSNLSFGVPTISASLNGDVMTIFATLQLAAGTTTVNQVWQEGPLSSGSPASHVTSGANLQSVGIVNFLSGVATTQSSSYGNP